MCGAPLVIPPLIEPSGHRPLKAVDFGFQSGVPGDLPTSPQPVFQTYFILNTGRDLGRGSAIGRRLGVDASIAPRLAPETISTRVSISIPLCNSGLNGIFGFQVGLEFGPVSAPDIRSIRWVLEG